MAESNGSGSETSLKQIFQSLIPDGDELMQGTVIGEKCELSYVIADKNVAVGDYRSIGGTVDYPVFVNKGSNV